MKKRRLTGAKTQGSLAYATVENRLKAFLLDYAVIIGYVVVLAAVNYGLILSGGLLEDVSPLFASPWARDGLAFLTLVLPVTLYFTFMESSTAQASVGKRIVRIRVVATDGAPLAIRQAFIRNLLKLLPWQIAHTSIYHIEGWPAAPEAPSPLVLGGFVLAWTMVAAYLASLLFTKSHRTPYDLVAGAVVIKAASSNVAPGRHNVDKKARIARRFGIKLK